MHPVTEANNLLSQHAPREQMRSDLTVSFTQRLNPSQASAVKLALTRAAKTYIGQDLQTYTQIQGLHPLSNLHFGFDLIIFLARRCSGRRAHAIFFLLCCQVAGVFEYSRLERDRVCVLALRNGRCSGADRGAGRCTKIDNGVQRYDCLRGQLSVWFSDAVFKECELSCESYQ